MQSEKNLIFNSCKFKAEIWQAFKEVFSDTSLLQKKIIFLNSQKTQIWQKIGLRVEHSNVSRIVGW
jgi:hypothetical protein